MKSIGIIGNGKFSQLLQQLLKIHAPSLEVHIFDRESSIINTDIVIPAVPIREFENVITKIAHTLSENAVVIDVCSVKEYPVEIMKKFLPLNTTIIATHPLFGPGTIQNVEETTNSQIVIDFIQGNKQSYKFIKSLLEKKDIRLIEMSPKEHDMLMAKSQFPAHVVANVLKKYKFKPTKIDTQSAEVLHAFEDMIQADTTLLQDMLKYNSYCKQELNLFQESYKSIMSLLRS